MSFKTAFKVSAMEVNPDLDSMKVNHWRLDSPEHGMKEVPLGGWTYSNIGKWQVLVSFSFQI